MKHTRAAAFAAVTVATALSLTACGGHGKSSSSKSKSRKSKSSSSSKSRGGSHNGGTGTKVKPCKLDDLAWKAKDEHSDKKAGNVVVTMTNTSIAKCSVTGFPDVKMKDGDGTSSALSRGDDVPRVTNLAPKSVAGFTLSYERAGSGKSAKSPTSLLVAPPHQGKYAGVKWPAGGIKGSYGDVEIHPIHTPV